MLSITRVTNKHMWMTFHFFHPKGDNHPKFDNLIHFMTLEDVVMTSSTKKQQAISFWFLDFAIWLFALTPKKELGIVKHIWFEEDMLWMSSCVATYMNNNAPQHRDASKDDSFCDNITNNLETLMQKKDTRFIMLIFTFHIFIWINSMSTWCYLRLWFHFIKLDMI